MWTSLRIGCARRGDYLRADHLVENVLKARIERGTKGLTKNSAKLDGGTAAEYENILAQVSFFLWKFRFLRVSVALIVVPTI